MSGSSRISDSPRLGDGNWVHASTVPPVVGEVPTAPSARAEASAQLRSRSAYS